VRYPRGEGVGVELPARGTPLQVGKGRIVRQGSDVAILSLGARLQASMAAAEALAEKGVTCTVADARFAKPLDHVLIRELVRNHRLLITVEEGSVGGFGSHVSQFVLNEDLVRPGFSLRALNLPDAFLEHDDQQRQYDQAGLNAADIVRVIETAL
jgi:1-deoxy-D-xylulose-5-phosphate synthase